MAIAPFTNPNQLTIASAVAATVPTNRNKKTRLNIESGGSSFSVNAFTTTVEEATAMGITRRKFEIIASAAADIAGTEFGGGIVEIEVDCTAYVADIVAEFIQYTE